MHTILLGLNHETAPVELRELVAMQGAKLGDALTRLTDCDENGVISEAVILSTCNRVEIYACSQHPEQGYTRLKHLFSEIGTVPVDELESVVYHKAGMAVAEHLFAVTSGINSMVIGENQIQGQVKQAYEAAKKYRAIGPILSCLFQSALSVGKRVRSETAINESSLSISSSAVELLKTVADDICQKKVLVLGSGKMSLLALKGLMKCGVQDLTIINRSVENAKRVSEELGIEAHGFDKLETFLKETDVVLSSTGAPHPILTGDLMERVMRKRNQRELVVIDIAVPRDVEPEVHNVSGIRLYNIDDLKERIEANREQRCREVQQVNRIVSSEVDNFHAWYQTLEVKPVIKDLKIKSEEIRRRELMHAVRKMGVEPSETEMQILEDLSRRIVNKILHQPFVRLRKEAMVGNGHNYTAAVRNLFGLEERTEKSGTTS